MLGGQHGVTQEKQSEEMGVEGKKEKKGRKLEEKQRQQKPSEERWTLRRGRDQRQLAAHWWPPTSRWMD